MANHKLQRTLFTLGVKSPNTQFERVTLSHTEPQYLANMSARLKSVLGYTQQFVLLHKIRIMRTIWGSASICAQPSVNTR